MKRSKNNNEFPKLSRFILYIGALLVFAFLNCFVTSISSENESASERYTQTKEYERMLTIYYPESLEKYTGKQVDL